MAIRRHVIAARNTTPKSLADALASLQVSEIEVADGWCWAMASVWTTSAHDVVAALANFDGPYFLVTTEDGCRWRFHLRKKGLPPFDTVHEFQWIRRDTDAGNENGDWADLQEETNECTSTVTTFPESPPLPEQHLKALDFDDNYFAPYADDRVEDATEEWKEPTPLEYIVETYEENGIPLPGEIIDALTGLPDAEIYPKFLERHGAHIADALNRFGVPHQREELLRILTGENVTDSEMDSDIGNTWRFLHHLGLGPKFAEALQEHEAAAEQGPAEDPAANVIKAAGKLPLLDVAGGPAVIPLAETFLMARMTYYQDNFPEYVARVQFDAPVDWPTGATPSYATWTPARKGFGGNLSLQGMDIPNIPKARRRLGELLARLPDGARLELLARGQYTRTRLAGRVEKGAWLVESASAPLTSDDIAEMLTIFRAAELRAPQVARDEDEAAALLDASASHMVLCNNPPDREGLQLKCHERREVEVLAALIFRCRMAGCWDFKKIDAHVARKFKEWRAFEKEMARDNALPATDRVVYAGTSSRFLEADYRARTIDKDMRANAKRHPAMDKEMANLGFTCLGAVVCEKIGGGILRCYASVEERCYSVGYVLPYGQLWHDYYTRFDDGTSLTTTSGLSEDSFRSLRILVRRCSRMPANELHDEHIKGVKRLAERGLTPAAIDATLEGLCKAMDEFLIRRLGA